MKTHIKIVGAVFIAFAVLLGACDLLFAAFLLFGKNTRPGGFGLLVFFLSLAFWFLQAGRGIWNLRAGSRLHGIILGGILLLILNGLLLFADGGQYARSVGQKIFHLTCMAAGLYAVVVLLFPSAGAEMQN